VALTSSRSLDIASDDWRALSACRDTDPSLFFPVGTTGQAVDQIASAKAVCETCDVNESCLRFALETNQDSGVWGGMSEEERRHVRRQARAAQARRVAS
jgi:WhiB family redox-sensing transcriptional regulator